MLLDLRHTSVSVANTSPYVQDGEGCSRRAVILGVSCCQPAVPTIGGRVAECWNSREQAGRTLKCLESKGSVTFTVDSQCISCYMYDWSILIYRIGVTRVNGSCHHSKAWCDSCFKLVANLWKNMLLSWMCHPTTMICCELWTRF